MFKIERVQRVQFHACVRACVRVSVREGTYGL